MKKRTIVCIVSVVLIGVGIATTAIGFALGGGVTGIGWSNDGLQVYGTGMDDDNRLIYVDKEVGLWEFQQIQVDMEYGDFTIEPSDHYGISYHGREGNFTYQVKDGKLILSQVIDSVSAGHYLFFFGGSNLNGGFYEQEYATVYVPENAAFDSVSIENNGGDVDISGISANDLYIKADYGNVLLSNVKGDEYTVTMESGKAEIKSLLGNSLNLSNAYGEITLEDISLEKDAEIYAESGNIELDDINIAELTTKNNYGDILGGTVSVRQAELLLESGECKLRKLDTDNIKVESSYGSVELELIQPLDDFSYDLYTDYGDLYIYDKKMGSQYESLQDDKDKKISVNCESGDIEIKQEE